MPSILQTRYYNLGKGNSLKYLVQTWSQEKSTGIKLPEVHGIGKGLDSNTGPKRQVIKPTVDRKTKEISQIKPSLDQVWRYRIAAVWGTSNGTQLRFPLSSGAVTTRCWSQLLSYLFVF